MNQAIPRIGAEVPPAEWLRCFLLINWLKKKDKYHLEYRRTNKARINSRIAAWNAQRPNYKKEYVNQRYHARRDELLTKQKPISARRWKEKRELILAQQKARRLANPKKAIRNSRKWGAAWRKKHAVRIKQKTRLKYLENKEKPGWMQWISIKNRIRATLKRTKGNQRTLKLVGCTSSELKGYLERKFKHGMTWENYGFYGWHLDHIRPISKFDLSDPEEVKRCFHFTNLQPEWWQRNMQKHDRVGPEYNNQQPCLML